MGALCTVFCFDCPCCDPDAKDQKPLLTTPRPPSRIARSKPFEVRDEGPPTDRKWYHGKISLEKAEYRMQTCRPGIRKDGTYLVYDNPKSPGEYVLLVYYKSELRKWKIIRRDEDQRYVLGNDSPGAVAHTSVRKLIEYHRGICGEPIKLQQGGSLKLSDYVFQSHYEQSSD